MIRLAGPILIAAALAACGTSGSQSTLPASMDGQLAPLPFQAAPAPTGPYRIGPLDQLNVTVFQVADLSVEKVQVDAAGQVQLPLVGSIAASGMTTDQLASAISAKLTKYLQNPQVSVTVAQAASQKVTVDGAVTEAGVYEMRGRTTLLQAVAMAKGPNETANTKRVVVFRTVDGQRMAAVFNLEEIRRGAMPDPPILGDDIIVVEGSAMKETWRAITRTLPALSIFRPF